jgi:predicted ATPase
MEQDRITGIRVCGMRALADVTLALNGLTVLIGDNGSGKSTLVEACELLRKAAIPNSFVLDTLHNFHGGLAQLMRHGAKELGLEVTVEGAGPKLEYQVDFHFVGTEAQIRQETLGIWSQTGDLTALNVLEHSGTLAKIFDPETQIRKEVEVSPRVLAVSSFGVMAQKSFLRMIDALKRIDVHPSFETRPLWLLNEQRLPVGLMRSPTFVEQAETLDRFGANLANCFYTLRNLGGEVWERVLEDARLGLGDDLRDISLPSPSRGNVELSVTFGSLAAPVPASSLSEGQLTYLSFLALAELGVSRSLVVIDEPELHLHPGLLVRVVWLLEKLSKTCPVVVATHSDRFLDALSAPGESVVLCELDEQRAAHLRRPNRATLDRWLEDYRGLGQLRAEGYEPHVFHGGAVS